MRRDRRQKYLYQTHASEPLDKGGYTIEAGGLPRPADVSDDLKRRFARRLGILQVPKVEPYAPERVTECDLGNRELPIYPHKQLILDSVRDNQVTIVVAETGSGKSTQIPQYLFEQGYQVTMTQPRRLAATMLAEQIEREVTHEDRLGTAARGIVGHHTAESNTITERTRISVVTDGLRLVQELNTRDEIVDEVLLIDEVHEWNTNIEVLIAWVKKTLRDNPKMRVVIMSATMDAHKLAYYFSDEVLALPSIIELPGRTNEIERFERPDSTAMDQAINYALEEKTVLIFLPGVREIEDHVDAISHRLHKKGVYGVTVLPLHGNLSPQQQALVEKTYHGPKIICATNVAQTSITIPDVDVVIDSGFERRVEIDQHGVESLELNVVSRADCDQRAGRCGRTKPGIYVLTRLDESTEFTPYLKRSQYPTPEILRTNVHRSTLAVAAAGLDFAELDLFHPVDYESIERSKYHLQVLGAFDENNEITQRGRRMNQFPVRPSLARMLTYAEEQNYPSELKAYAAAMVASIEVGDLPNYMEGDEWRRLSDAKDSDFLAQLDMFLWAQGVTDRKEFYTAQLNVRHVERVHQLHDKLVRRMNAKQGTLDGELSDSQKQLLKDCVVAGMVDFVYQAHGGGYSDALGRYKEVRDISDRSMVSGRSNYVVGTPYKIPPHGNYANEKHILQHVTKTTDRDLGRIASHLCGWVADGIEWRDNKPMLVERRMFRPDQPNPIPIGEYRTVKASWTPELRATILSEVQQHPGSALREMLQIKRELEQLWHRDTDVQRITQDEVEKVLKKLATKNVLNPGQLDDKLREHMVTHQISVDTYLSAAKRENIKERSPDYMEWNGLELQLRYQSGEPLLRHVDKSKIVELLQLGDTLKLPDGRKVMIKLGRKKQTLWQFAQDRKKGTL